MGLLVLAEPNLGITTPALVEPGNQAFDAMAPYGRNGSFASAQGGYDHGYVFVRQTDSVGLHVANCTISLRVGQ